jgi:hypothetical protein
VLYMKSLGQNIMIQYTEVQKIRLFFQNVKETSSPSKSEFPLKPRGNLMILPLL